MESFQVDTKTVEIRNALLDLAEQNGWRTGERKYYANGMLWLVVSQLYLRVGGNETANNCQQKSIEYAIDVLSKPPVKPICAIDGEPVLRNEHGVAFGETVLLADKIKLIYEAVFGKPAQTFTPAEAALLSALLDRLAIDDSLELERMAIVIDAKLDGMGACDGVRHALVGTIELESAHPF